MVNKVDVSPIYKKGLKEGSGNSKLISLTLVLVKVMEQIFLGTIICQMKHVAGKTITDSPTANCS